MLIPLHTKSHYSLGFGTASIPRLVERARALGLSALALTDMENLYGQVIFHRLAREKGLRPITGVELQASSSSKGRSVLLAQNPTGYQNLCRIITRRKLGTSPDQLSKAFENQGRPKEEAREDLMESLRGRSDGLILLTDDPPTLEKILSLPGFDRKSARLLLIRPGKSMTAERKVAEASSRL